MGSGMISTENSWINFIRFWKISPREWQSYAHVFELTNLTSQTFYHTDLNYIKPLSTASADCSTLSTRQMSLRLADCMTDRLNDWAPFLSTFDYLQRSLALSPRRDSLHRWFLSSSPTNPLAPPLVPPSAIVVVTRSSRVTDATIRWKDYGQ